MTEETSIVVFKENRADAEKEARETMDGLVHPYGPITEAVMLPYQTQKVSENPAAWQIYFRIRKVDIKI